MASSWLVQLSGDSKSAEIKDKFSEHYEQIVIDVSKVESLPKNPYSLNHAKGLLKVQSKLYEKMNAIFKDSAWAVKDEYYEPQSKKSRLDSP